MVFPTCSTSGRDQRVLRDPCCPCCHLSRCFQGAEPADPVPAVVQEGQEFGTSNLPLLQAEVADRGNLSERREQLTYVH